ncbi:hypothetical protein ATANTOWER_025894, partial [Ataeniobius toweri]|nr:hypothetical protein [Ataeniobius toweri]
RDGEGVRVFWDRLKEPSFASRWNPFANDFPFITFTHHPVRNIDDTFAALCDLPFRTVETESSRSYQPLCDPAGEA